MAHLASAHVDELHTAVALKRLSAAGRQIQQMCHPYGAIHQSMHAATLKVGLSCPRHDRLRLRSLLDTRLTTYACARALQSCSGPSLCQALPFTRPKEAMLQAEPALWVPLPDVVTHSPWQCVMLQCLLCRSMGGTTAPNHCCSTSGPQLAPWHSSPPTCSSPVATLSAACSTTPHS